MLTTDFLYDFCYNSESHVTTQPRANLVTHPFPHKHSLMWTLCRLHTDSSEAYSSQPLQTSTIPLRTLGHHSFHSSLCHHHYSHLLIMSPFPVITPIPFFMFFPFISNSLSLLLSLIYHMVTLVT